MRFWFVVILEVILAHLCTTSLVFTNGGLYKVILGYAVPLDLSSPMGINYFHNLQFQYQTVSNVSQIEYVQLGGRGSRHLRSVVTRKQIYQVIEHMLDSKGVDRSCLLRSICEMARAPVIHSGLVGDLFQTLLTPYDRDEDSEYSAAWRLGHQGQYCQYGECPQGSFVLDQVSHYVSH